MKNNESAQNAKRKKYMKFVRNVFIVLACIIVVRGFLIGTVRVKGSSMEPTFSHGDICVVNKLYYRFAKPQRGDIIVCKNNTSNSKEKLIKRVIGIPGDEINIVLNDSNKEIEFILYINGEEQTEVYIKEMMQQSGNMEYPYIVPEGSYFVMGDNRNASTDSRTKHIGAISQDAFVGKVFFK